MTLKLAFMLLAVVLLLLAAADVKAPRINLLALGLTFWALSSTL